MCTTQLLKKENPLSQLPYFLLAPQLFPSCDFLKILPETRSLVSSPSNPEICHQTQLPCLLSLTPFQSYLRGLLRWVRNCERRVESLSRNHKDFPEKLGGGRRGCDCLTVFPVTPEKGGVAKGSFRSRRKNWPLFYFYQFSGGFLLSGYPHL